MYSFNRFSRMSLLKFRIVEPLDNFCRFQARTLDALKAVTRYDELDADDALPQWDEHKGSIKEDVYLRSSTALDEVCYCREGITFVLSDTY